MARATSHGHGGHGNSSFSQEKLDEVKDDIVRLKRRIRQEKAAGNNVDVLENQLGDLEIKQREHERNDPVAHRKRRIAELEGDDKIRELEEKAKNSDPLPAKKRRLESLELDNKVHHAEEEAKKHHKMPWGTLTILTVLGVLAYAFFSKIPVQHRADNLLLFVGVPMAVIVYFIFRKKKSKEEDSHSSSHH